MSNSDFDFFDVISQYIPLNLVLNYSKFYHINDEDNDITRIRRGLVSSDDWQWLHNTLSRLLNYGDSWTAVWLSQIVLKSHNNIPPILTDVMGLVLVFRIVHWKPKCYFVCGKKKKESIVLEHITV